MQGHTHVTGNKKALLIGINYIGTSSALAGCINDVHALRSFISVNYNFPTDANHMVVLTDDQRDPKFQPTRANITAGIDWLVRGAQPGDSLFISFSGHGGTQKDTDGDESDGSDETILPIDFKRAGVIVDDELNARLVRPLPAGCRLFAVFDSCHSGSVLDLPFTYLPDGSIKRHTIASKLGKSLLDGGKAFALSGGSALTGALSLVKSISSKNLLGGGGLSDEDRVRLKGSMADVVCFSGCKDAQTSADSKTPHGMASGAMSYSLITALASNRNQNWSELLANMRNILKGKYTQVPQLSAGRLIDTKARVLL
ncbi:hypothetical protein CXG81DRAFT_10786 [Caulochytrium protostelioides]|uniref:Peptidase C14 caspase domain-containing protein n=1 Tax=Caulochytrium protostelioides TaxID=1555241 RepID=A0A4P9XAR1_9FUNG|nr:hypothetical protein CXG81DRAFT_10786 [Caulochytrium protostelioides]|eukprot:RKP02432.1 hypothetical protein CXG81DRAFT_10786 [Caulochytrium protostelioides]